MRQTGVVVENRGTAAVVRFVRSTACGHCTACFRLGEDAAEVELENVLHASVGDAVVIELHEGGVLGASLIVYGAPLAAFVAGVALGSLWGELYAALAALLFAGGTFAALRALEPCFSRMRGFKPRMVEILEPTQSIPKGENDHGKTTDQS